jgi:hypothetical protein
MKQPILGFFGDFRVLSNFWPCVIEYCGYSYQNTEAAFQGNKSNSQEDKERFSSMTAAEAKRESKKLRLRDDWLAVRDQIMLDLIRIKFSSANPRLGR